MFLESEGEEDCWTVAASNVLGKENSSTYNIMRPSLVNFFPIVHREKTKLKAHHNIMYQFITSMNSSICNHLNRLGA
jgi:hypothetical protein